MLKIHFVRVTLHGILQSVGWGGNEQGKGGFCWAAFKSSVVSFLLEKNKAARVSINSSSDGGVVL